MAWLAAKGALAAAGALATAIPAAAQSTTNAQLSAQIVQWGQANASAYAEAMAASRNPVGAVPVPPLIDPSCQLCGQQQNSVANGAQQAQAWINRALQPEDRYMVTLLNILKTAQQNQESDINTLTPAAQAVVHQYSSTLIQAAIKRLGNHLVLGKAIPMAKQNLNEPRRAYAGILFMIAAAKEGGLLNDNDDAMRKILDLARQWQQTVVDRADQDIEQGHRYNLCPAYLLMLRQLDTLSAEINSISVDELANKISEWQKLLYFSVNMSLHVSGQTNKGSINADWEGKARLKLVLDSLGSCYKPEIDDGGVMQMSIQPYDFQWVQHDKDEDVQIQYQSPNTFDVKLNLIQLNLCDPQPVLQLPLAGLHAPIETYEVKGKSFQNMMFGSFMGAVVQANHTNQPKVNQMTGRSYPSSPGGILTPLTGGSSGGGNDQNDVLAPLVYSGSQGNSSNGTSASSSTGSSSSAGNDVLAPLVPSTSQISNGPVAPANSPSANSAPTTSSTSTSRQSSSSSQVSPINPADAMDQIKDLQKKINAHMGDTAWIRSADGQATLAQYRQLAKGMKKWGDEQINASSNSANRAPLLPANSQASQAESLQLQMNAHQGDPGWLTSPEGQAAIAQAQQSAMAKAQAKLNGAGIVVPKEANMMSLAASFFSVQLPWTNGQIEPVNQTLRAKKNGNRIELKITVRQAPQQ
jgi:hypothetical protein